MVQKLNQTQKLMAFSMPQHTHTRTHTHARTHACMHARTPAPIHRHTRTHFRFSLSYNLFIVFQIEMIVDEYSTELEDNSHSDWEIIEHNISSSMTHYPCCPEAYQNVSTRISLSAPVCACLPALGIEL